MWYYVQNVMVEKTGYETIGQIANRLSDENATEVEDHELTAMNVKEDGYINYDDPAIVAYAENDVDPVKYFLVKSGNRFVSLKLLNKLRPRDGGSKWIADAAGKIEVEPVGLQDDWRDDLSSDYSEDKLEQFEQAYEHECEHMWNVVDEVAAFWDGSKVYMNTREPWLGWDKIREEIGVSQSDWKDDIRPAMASARPRMHSGLEATMRAEYTVKISFNEGDDQ